MILHRQNKKTGWILAASLLLISTIISGCRSSQTIDDQEQPSPNLVQLGERSYRLALPEQNFDPNKVYKLLLAFHPSGGSASGMQATTKFEKMSDDYIVVYPQSQVEEWEEGCQCNKPHRLNIDDLSYVDGIIEDVKQKYHILDDEIYAVGFSQGGLFTQNLLCNRSDVFNGIASIGAPMSVQLSQTCTVSTPTDYLMVHGTADNVLPFKGKSHTNFGLIGSEQAIELIAQLNQITSEKIKTQVTQSVITHDFQDEQTLNRLVEIAGGGHVWHFNGFETSSEILQFFAQASTQNLPDYSHLYRVNEMNYHVRTMGAAKDKPTLVLLSGPNYNFHSDSAWFSLLQPMLAEQYRVHVIDRLGNGYSEFSDKASYQKLAEDLPEILQVLNVNEVLLVGFSSSNISSKLLVDSGRLPESVNVKGMVWIDPDILTDEAIAMYQGYPVTWYREKSAQLQPYLASGAWTERTKNKLITEKEEITALINESYQAMMDWSYFNDISERRQLVTHQQTRALEIAHYHDDLELARQFEYSNDIPISIIDTDFERKDIANAQDDAQKQQLTAWMTQGTAWSQSITSKTGGIYRAVEDADHLVMFQYPNVIVEVIEQTLALN